MKRSLKRVIVAAIATGALAVGLPVSSAAAITSPQCGNRTDFVMVTYQNGNAATCFANAGVINKDMPNVIRISSGNNNIRFVDNGRTLTMSKQQVNLVIDGSSHHITRLRIL